MDWLSEMVRSAQPRPGEELAISMSAPPGTEFLDHGRDDGHVPILAALAIADVQARRLLPAMNIAHAEGDRFPHAQPAMIDEPQTGAETGFRQGGEQGLDFGAREDHGQNIWF